MGRGCGRLWVAKAARPGGRLPSTAADRALEETSPHRNIATRSPRSSVCEHSTRLAARSSAENGKACRRSAPFRCAAYTTNTRRNSIYVHKGGATRYTANHA